MLLVPLLAASEFKCQLNAYNFVTVTECFYERVLDRQGASRGTGVPPSALGSLSSWSVWQLLWVWQCCAAQPRCPGVHTFWMWLCVCVSECVCVSVCTNTCLAVALGRRRVQVPPKQTSCTTRSLDVCVHECVHVNVCLSAHVWQQCV